MKQKILSLLVLLLTAATGAWAADPITVTWDKNTLLNQAALTAGGSVTIDGVTMTCVAGTAGDDGYGYYKISDGNIKFTTELGNFTQVKLGLDSSDYPNGEGWNGETWTGSSNTVSFTKNHIKLNKITFTIEPASESDVEVETNAEKEGESFTEAKFAMPAGDATAVYELVRDMTVQMTVKVGEEGKDGFRIRVQKNAQEKFEPAEMEFDAMLALFTVNDEIEEKTLAFYGQDAVCDLKIYAVDDSDQPTGDAITFNALTPGRYVAIATAAENSNYDGETAPSNIFELYQGYEVEIPAGEFITYYKDEAIYVEDENVKLYTISSVDDVTATAVELPSAPANTPMLVKNTSDEDLKVLLIPTASGLLSAIQRYPGFKGTLEETTIPASSEESTSYACNGTAFVYVKNELKIGANKCWLEVPATAEPTARKLTIVFGDDTTGIDNVNGNANVNGSWYDLNGRKLDTVPTKKGIYILNGRKVVVK